MTMSEVAELVHTSTSNPSKEMALPALDEEETDLRFCLEVTTTADLSRLWPVEPPGNQWTVYCHVVSMCSS